METKDTLKIKGTYDFKIIGVDGKVKDSWSVDNLITNAGLAELINLAGNVSTPAAFTYLALGTDSTAVAASQTALVAEITDTGLARHAGTVTRTTTTVTNDTLSIVYEWTSSGQKAIEEIGVFNASSSGVMLSRALTGIKTVSNGEKIQATYTLKIS